MEIKDLLVGCPGLTGIMGNLPSAPIQHLRIDSRDCQAGDVYFAIRGSERDGHVFLPEVCRVPVTAVVVEASSAVPADFPGGVVVVENVRKALDYCAAQFFSHPAERLFCVGVTGTNGKTSITHMVEHVFNHLGWPTGVMGTINHHLGGRIWASQMTTPDPVTLQGRLREFVDGGARAAALEVSSHALAQYRADQIPFSVAVFTNLTRDHLDYHGDMASYFAAKQRLFLDIPQRFPNQPFTAVISHDDPHGLSVETVKWARRWTYGRSPGADFCFKVEAPSFLGSKVHLQSPFGKVSFLLPVPGQYNVANAVAAVACACAANFNLPDIVKALESFTGVPGRLERVWAADPRAARPIVLVDYAHSDAALRAVLETLREIRDDHSPETRIITVFGCGGDRDQGKRPLMLQAALDSSDRVVVTSDNPRREDPERIMADILTGVRSEAERHRVLTEVDRRAAISLAIHIAQPKDVVLIAGKGHEDYQVIGTTKTSFSDVQVAKECLG